MKKQTMLKLILCFLIIFVGMNVQEVNAATLCSSCNFNTIENGRCIWKEQATGTLIHSLDVIDVGNGKFYHKENINCSGCSNSTAVYCSKYMGNGRFDNEYKCLSGKTLIKIGGEYYHQSSKKCQTHKVNVVDVDGGYKCPNDFSNFLIEDSNRNVAHKIASCSTCTDGDILNYGSDGYKCINGSSTVNCVAAGTEYYHKIGDCNTCPGTIYKDENGNYACNEGAPVVINGNNYVHTNMSNICKCGGTVNNNNCSNCGEVVAYSYQWWKVIATCNAGGKIIDKNGVYCVTHENPLYDDGRGGYSHVKSGGGNPGGGNPGGGTPVVVTGGPSAEAFFNAGKDNAKKGYDVVDGKIDPLLHIQSLIMMAGVYIAVIVVLIYACQWMLATPAKRQELKASLWPLVIGVILLVMGPKLAILIVTTLLG